MWFCEEGFNTKTVIDLGLDYTDVVIIKYLMSVYRTTDKYLYLDNTLYVFTTFDTILEKIPILNFTKEDIVKFIQKYNGLGLLKYHKDLNLDNSDSYAIYTFTDKFNELVR